MPVVHRLTNAATVHMYFEMENPPHFHVVEAEYEAKIDIRTLEVMRGTIRRRTLEKARQWAAGNQGYLLEKWDRFSARSKGI